MMKKLLLTMSLSLAALPVFADEMSPASAKGAVDLPPVRTTTPPPPAAPVEAAPVVVAPPPKVEEVAPPRAAAPAPEPSVMPAKVAPVARAGDTGWFVGAGLGQSHNRDYDCNGCGDPITSLDDSGFAYKLFAGYRPHRNFALSVGYVDLADTDAASVGGMAEWTDKLKVDGFYAAAHGILPVTNNIDVFATLGALRWNQKVAFDDGAPLSGSFDGTDVMYGLGASYALGQVKLQAEWNRFNNIGTNDVNLGHTDDYDLFTVNMVYQF